ncbi:hypothetical protein U9K52_10040 [Chryseobacterium sp. MHB01]|uniref:hypothetical protein n=1 Tax=Chryseobacterium sp. MHB01 TaxID=3109433 RepID=UPI002AFFA2F6|nr:hypothetical protein [Chryseobacterium sp. MHB01]MEA1849253.1 hypothetical protein [Chryseobacterium sp. MHB01]
MKAKILLLTAIAAAIIYSCSSERDEEVKNQVSQKVDLKLKTNSNKGETSKIGDTIDAPNHQTIILDPGTGIDPEPTNPTNPNDPEIVHPGDVKPPKP